MLFNGVVTLVVAEIDETGINLVADTKMQYREQDATKTRQVFKHAHLKVAILRDDVVVGVADDVVCGLNLLAGLRDVSVDDLLGQLASKQDVEFLVGALDGGPRLWTVRDGTVTEETTVGRCAIGDQDAYAKHFLPRYREWPPDCPKSFRLMSSMQWLLGPWGPCPSVGGFLTRVATSRSDEFRFVSDPMRVGPWLLEIVNAEMTANGGSLVARVPAGGDPSGYEVRAAVGRPPTTGAIAYFVPQAGRAWLFPHERPWERIPLAVTSMPELIDSAAAEYRQVLAEG